jgi:NADH:ubiquinone oxidoreductase subunit 2 (subunit N)
VFFNFYFSIIEKNIYIYLIIFLLTYFFNTTLVFLTFSRKNVNSNNVIKIINKAILNKNYKYYLIIAFGSFLGIPPLSGFVSKFILVYYVFIKYNLFTLLFFYSLILFSLFFYVQILKLIKRDNLNASDLKKTNKNNKNKNKFYKVVFLNVMLIFTLFFLFISL